MSDLTIVVNGAPVPVYLGESTQLAGRIAAEVSSAVADAVGARDEAQEYLLSVLTQAGGIVFDTKAELTAALAGLTANSFALVGADESRGGERTIYRKVSGSAVYKFSVNRIANLISTGTPHLGQGEQVGQPSGTLTLAEAGAGALTGTYRYAYAESDGTGLTPISAHTAITVAAKQVLITVPQIRRGLSGRRLYRTKAGDTSRYYLLKVFNGGDDYYKSEFVDNVADGSLGAERTDLSTDTTMMYALELKDGVRFTRSLPRYGTNPADKTGLNGFSQEVAGAYGIDEYGEYLGRTRFGNTFGSEKCGDQGTHFLASFVGPRVDVDSPVTVAKLQPRGSLVLTRYGALTDPSAADGNASVLSATAAFGTGNTATAAGVDVAITGAGTAAFNQIAGRFALTAGYTGSAITVGLSGENASAHSGKSYGVRGRATGAAGFSIGLIGATTAGTKQVGVYGTLDDIDPATLSMPGGVNSCALVGTNATTVGDIIQGYDNTTLVFRVENGGDVTIKNVGATALLNLAPTTGGANLRLEGNGGNYVGIGSSNNVDARFRANGLTCFTATIRQTLNLPDLAGDPASPQDGDIWRNGSNLKCRLGGVTKTITVA